MLQAKLGRIARAIQNQIGNEVVGGQHDTRLGNGRGWRLHCF